MVSVSAKRSLRRRVLNRLLLPKVGEKVMPEDLLAHLEKRGRPVPLMELQQALAALEARDIVGRADPRSNLYRFRVDLIRRWIYATRPAYEKVI